MGTTADPTTIVRAIVDQTVALLTAVGMDADAVPAFLASRMIGRIFLNEATTEGKKLATLRALRDEISNDIEALVPPNNVVPLETRNG